MTKVVNRIPKSNGVKVDTIAEQDSDVQTPSQIKEKKILSPEGRNPVNQLAFEHEATCVASILKSYQRESPHGADPEAEKVTVRHARRSHSSSQLMKKLHLSEKTNILQRRTPTNAPSSHHTRSASGP